MNVYHIGKQGKELMDGIWSIYCIHIKDDERKNNQDVMNMNNNMNEDEYNLEENGIISNIIS